QFNRALALLDRLTDRERLQVRARIEGWRGNREGAIALRTAMLAEYPDDPRMWGEIGYEYMRLGRHSQAVEAYQRQLAIDSSNATDFINLATAYKGLGAHEQA